MCYLTIIGVGFLAWLIPVLLFTRHIPYHIERELEAGTRIYEYTPGMIHVKMLVVDDLWSAIGTTNFDNRSFEHNDEVNLGVRNARIAERLTADNEADIANSQEVTLERWRQRPLWEKLIGSIAWGGGFRSAFYFSASYRALFETLAARRDVWLATPAEVARHWRTRHQTIMGLSSGLGAPKT